MLVIEYIWLDDKYNYRSKTRVIHMDTSQFEKRYKLLDWNYDGSSTNQASGDSSEVILKPVYYCIDPFRTERFKESNKYILLLCATYTPDNKPLESNNYEYAKSIFNKDTTILNNSQPWYGIEQEFFMMKEHKFYNTHVPLSYEYNIPNQYQYYCGSGAENIKERDEADLILHYALKAGLQVSGLNAEVAVSQWEIQIGPIMGIEAAHQVHILRYIMKRVGEIYRFCVDFHPKPTLLNNSLQGIWNGSGLHTNFSTSLMRQDNGYKYILEAMDKLKDNHESHILVYGEDNHLRMTGSCETSNINQFSFGISDRTASIRIPSQVYKEQRGYFEDRRPAANADPYLVCAKIYETCCLDKYT